MDTTDDGLPEGSVSVKFVLLIIGAIGTAISGGWGFHHFVANHVKEHLVPAARAMELETKLLAATTATKDAAQATQTVATALSMHIAEERISKSRELLNALTSQLSETQLWEAANRPNDVSRARKADLAARIATQRDYVRCLENGRSICVNAQ